MGKEKTTIDRREWMMRNCNGGSRKGFRQHHISETAGLKPQIRFILYSPSFISTSYFSFYLASTSLAETYVSGNITSNTTWGVAGSPYIVTGDITVYHTSRTYGEYFRKLTIEPGVEVRFNPGTGLYIGKDYSGYQQVTTERSVRRDSSDPDHIYIQFDQCPAGRLEGHLLSQSIK